MCNASPIIALSIIGQLDLLWQMFEVYIPSAVYQEVVFNQFDHDFGKCELDQALSEEHIKLYNVQDQDFVEKLYGHFHRGELEVIAGAIEMGINVVLIDERSARNLAETLLIRPLGVLGLLRKAKYSGRIDSVKPMLDLLIKYKFRISAELYNKTLKELGEI